MALLTSSGNLLAADRSQYLILGPTPDHLLREMTTDRPDATESPFTVDAGRIQVETNIAGYSRFREVGGATVETYEFGTTNVRFGLTPNLEAGFVWQPYGVVRTKQSGVPTLRQSGIGGFELRGKYNLWGNDIFDKAGATALALLPFISFPTDDGNGISPTFAEGGIIVPFAIQLSEKFALALNGGAAWIRDDAGSGYRPEYLASVSLAYEWNDAIGTYYELAARFHTDDPRGDAVIFGTGVTYSLGKNVQLDAGVNFGLTSAADRINPFVGLSTRF